MNTENQNATVAERIITIYATRGSSEPIDILSSAVTWGDFIPVLESKGYNVSKVLCTESHTKMDLVNKLAVLPTVPFTIFIRNKETKSGADLSYKELRLAISGFIAADGNSAKEHFNQSKNYTTKSTAELLSLHASYKPQVGAEVVEAKEVPVNVADVVETVAKAKVVTNSDRASKISILLVEILANTNTTDVVERVEMMQEEIEGLLDAISEDTDAVEENPATPVGPTAEEIAEQARKDEEAEAKRVAQEAKDKRVAELKAQAKEMGY